MAVVCVGEPAIVRYPVRDPETGELDGCWLTMDYVDSYWWYYDMPKPLKRINGRIRGYDFERY